MSRIKKEELVSELCRVIDCPGTSGQKAEYTDALHPYKNLFSPISYNALRARTRIVYIPERALCAAAPSSAEKEHYFSCVSGGAGVLVTPPVAVSLSAFSAAPWRELCAGVHARGGLVFAQLGADSEKCDPAGFLSPDRECRRLIRLAVQSAQNAMAVGFDGICIDGSAGTLPDRMSSKAWNRSKLGKFAKAGYFGTELVRELRNALGEAVPILYRIALSHAVRESYGEQLPENKELAPLYAQRSIPEAFRQMEALAAVGADMFEIGLGCAETPWLASPASYLPAGCYLDAARAVVERFAATDIRTKSGRSVCILGSGRIDTPDTAEKALRSGMCHAVVLGSAMDADPAWGSKARSGKCAGILPYYPPAAKCVPPAPPADAKHIAVVGGGMRGMLAALAAAERGIEVELFEKELSLGGELRALAALPQNYAAKNYLLTLSNLVAERQNIRVKTGVKADSELLKAGRYDAVLLTNGGKAVIPPVEGWGEIPSITAQELLTAPEKLGETRKNIVILGESELGCACALYLREQLSCSRVALISSREGIMPDSSASDRAWMAHRLSSLGVRMFTLSSPCKIQESYLYFRERCGKKPDPAATWKTFHGEIKANSEKLRSIRAELIVLAESVPETSLAVNLQADGIL